MTEKSKKSTKKNIQAEIKKDLFSPVEETVLAAVTKAEKYGDATFIEPLLQVYISTEVEEVKEAVSQMLSSLKVSDAEAELVAALENPKFIDYRADILSFIWESGFHPIEHVALFARIATSGSYMETLESLTVIEQFEPPMQEDSLIEALIEVRTYLADKPDPEKKDLLVVMHTVLSDLEKAS